MPRPPRIPIRRIDRGQAAKHPVAIWQARKDLRAARTDIKIHVYAHEDGADATKLLANLAWFIALALKLEACIKGDTPRMRRLHGALRNVQAMCLNGYIWSAGMAAAMDSALEDADCAIDEMEADCDIGLNDAQTLHDMVMARVVRSDTVLGVEMFSQFRPAADKPVHGASRKGVPA